MRFALTAANAPRSKGQGLRHPRQAPNPAQANRADSSRCNFCLVLGSSSAKNKGGQARLTGVLPGPNFEKIEPKRPANARLLGAFEPLNCGTSIAVPITQNMSSIRKNAMVGTLHVMQIPVLREAEESFDVQELASQAGEVLQAYQRAPWCRLSERTRMAKLRRAIELLQRIEGLETGRIPVRLLGD